MTFPTRDIKAHLRGFLKFLYFKNFPIVAFLTSFLVFVTALLFLRVNLTLPAYILSLFLFIESVLYYTLYFLEYQELTDSHSQEKYYLDIYYSWGILFFGLFSACSFSLFAFINDILFFGGDLFGISSYTGTLIYFFTQIIDGATFSLLSSFGISLFEPEHGLEISEPCKNLILCYEFEFSKLNLISSVYKYAVSFTIDFAFWSSIFTELAGWIEANRKVNKIIQNENLEPEPLNADDIKRNKLLLRRVNSGEINLEKQSFKLVELLKDSDTKEVRDIYLRIMQEDFFHPTVFLSCLEYFKQNPDKRFKKICQKIKNRGKKKIIEEFEYRQIKKQRWRGRGKKPNQ